MDANEFIDNYRGLAFSYVYKRAISLWIFDEHIILSTALQACWDTFSACEKEGKLGKARTECGILRSKCSRIFYHNAVKHGYIPSRDRVYFPTSWVSWEDYFSPTYDIDFSKADLGFLLETDTFTPSEKLFLMEAASGLAPLDIGKKLGYGPDWAHQTFRKLRGRCKDTDKTKAVTSGKRRGPYKKKPRLQRGHPRISQNERPRTRTPSLRKDTRLI